MTSRTLSSFSPKIRRMFCFHEIMRRLGFSADDIFFITQRLANVQGNPLAVFGTLKIGPVFRCALFTVKDTKEHEENIKEWQAFCDQALAKDSFLPEELTDMYLQELRKLETDLGSLPSMIAAIERKGIVAPCRTN